MHWLIFGIGIFVGIVGLGAFVVQSKNAERLDLLEEALIETEDALDDLTVFCGKQNHPRRLARTRVALSQKPTATPQSQSDVTDESSDDPEIELSAPSDVAEEISKGVAHLRKDPIYAGFFDGPTPRKQH